MISILLLILKIIGIIIASVLGLALLLVLIVLFVPIRYDVYASYYEKPVARVNVTWLLKIIRFKLLYENELGMRLKILFFTIFDNKNTKEKSAEKKNKKAKKVKKKTDLTVDEESKDTKEPEEVNMPEESNEPEEVNMPEESKEPEEEEIPEESNEPDEVNNQNKTNEPEEEEIPQKKNNISEIIKKIKEKCIEILKLVKGVINKSQEAGDNLKKKIEEFSAYYNDPENRKLVFFLIEQLKKLLRILKPKKVKIKGKIGFDDPATCGQVFMYISLIQGLFGFNLGLVPDFENDVKEGEIRMKGSFMLFGIIVILIKVYFNKQFRKIIGK